MKGMILDLDGVLKRGGEPIPGSVQAVKEAVNSGISICYLTNNSTRTRKQVMISLESIGYPEAPVITSAYGSAKYIKEKMGPSRCLVLGEKGLVQELERMGHDAIPAGEGRGVAPVEASLWMSDVGEDLSDLEVDCVVAGLDRTLTYTRLADALWALRSGADFIATNSDPSLPWEDGRILPGAGSVISALETCSGIRPTVIGKPNPYTTFLAANEMGLEPADILMVGDRLDTDIAAGITAGCRVARVLTGDISVRLKFEKNVFDDLHAVVKALLDKGSDLFHN